MTFSKAIQTKDLTGLTEVVARAAKIYNGSSLIEPDVETVYGNLPFSAVLDEETRWQLCAIAYSEILTLMSMIPAEADAKVEAAKLITTNATLQAMCNTTNNVIDELI